MASGLADLPNNKETPAAADMYISPPIRQSFPAASRISPGGDVTVSRAGFHSEASEC